MSRRRSLLVSAAVVVAIVAGILTVGVFTGAPVGDRSGPPAPTRVRLAGLEAAQQAVKDDPTDARAWAALAIGYVARAKATSDPTLYVKAEGAVAMSLRLNTSTNDIGFAAQAALRASEHDFRGALASARAGLRLNSYSSTLYGALGDAYTQLGQYALADQAIDRMNTLLPGVPAFTRASYALELRGRIPDARAALQRALQDATSPADVAFTRLYLGELAFNYGGDATAALAEYEQGLSDSPKDPYLLAAKAKALVALGRAQEAAGLYRSLVNAVPQPQFVLELAELEQSLGSADASAQFALFAVEEKLFRANHVTLDVEPTLFEADHGSPSRALAYARAGWQARPFLEMADAYGWALYVNHRYQEALVWSQRAFVTHWPSALNLFHRGMIEKALGQKAAARDDLRRALALNPHFNPLQVPRAQEALAALGG